MVKFRQNSELLKKLNKQNNVESIKTANKIPDYDTVNSCGHGAYSIEDKLLLVSKLNTQKMEPTFYKSESTQMKELQDLIEKIATENPDFVAKAIIWSRCKGEGLRTVNHLAAAIISLFIQGKDYAKRFYSLWNKKKQKGGCIYRLDDMSEIQIIYKALTNRPLANAMKKGFKQVLESVDNYQIGKYKKTVIDIANLVHPNVSDSIAKVEIEGTTYSTIDALMKGMSISSDTWEVAQSEAGQIVAEAVKSGKISKDEAEKVLTEAKADNWRSLLDEGKLGILAALRNLRNIYQTNDQDIVDKVCDLVSNKDLLIKGKIMPYQIDLAYESLLQISHGDLLYRKLSDALKTGIENSVSNLKELLTGRNLVIVDCSGSMSTSIHVPNGGYSRTSCAEKASLIAAMICKSINADLIQFGNRAEYVTYNSSSSIFDLSRYLKRSNMGGTSLYSAFDLITKGNRAYDRIFILSDNECNYGCQKDAYRNYVRTVADPYIYSIDMAANGTKPLSSDKVTYLFGYGYAMFDMIRTNEFNPSKVLDEIEKIEL